MLSSDTVEVDGVSLELRRIAGSGTPILLLHEALGSVSHWRDFPDRLAEATGRPVIVWSRQGFGRSAPLPAPLDPDYHQREAAAVRPLLDVLGIDRVHAFGHSDGASIALILGAIAPDRVKGLVLEAPHVTVEETTLRTIAETMEAYGSGALRAKLARHHLEPDGVVGRWSRTWLDPAFRHWSIADRLSAIQAPALLIQGLDDEYFGLGQLDRIEAVLGRTERLELTRCGHAPHRDRPDAVLQAARRFLDTCDDGEPHPVRSVGGSQRGETP